MKVRIPIEQVRVGDVDPATRKKVVRVVRCGLICLATLEGGRPEIEGYCGKMVEVERSGDR